jgi:hypothetical protein
MAVTGFIYTLTLACFWVPYWLVWSSHTEQIPLDVQARSYLTDHLCGPDTKIACPNPNVPFFRQSSVTITPDGKLYVPAGVKLPHDPTTFAQAKAMENRH